MVLVSRSVACLASASPPHMSHGGTLARWCAQSCRSVIKHMGASLCMEPYIQYDTVIYDHLGVIRHSGLFEIKGPFHLFTEEKVTTTISSRVVGSCWLLGLYSREEKTHHHEEAEKDKSAHLVASKLGRGTQETKEAKECRWKECAIVATGRTSPRMGLETVSC